uniref:Uncharacterized protein n=1 Tax=Arundo donax TaxID=35708 RepID=A0A0A8YGT7_ARUDO
MKQIFQSTCIPQSIFCSFC